MGRRSSRHWFYLAVLMLCCLVGCMAWANAPSNPPGADAARGNDPGSPNVTLPGPLRAFLRMAAISQQATSQQVLPLLARNVEMEGYGWHGKKPVPTEFLILLQEYLHHARRLLSLAGPRGVIRVASCKEAQPLLGVLGYKMSRPCGPHAAVEASNSTRAFLTIDSGFPLTALTNTLRGGKPFVYSFGISTVPAVLKTSDWTQLEQDRDKKWNQKTGPDNLVDALVRDPGLSRLYWALSRMDPETVSYLEQTFGLRKLVSLAPTLDFYGSEICVRSGRVAVPGGPAAEASWKSVVGASPANPPAFITRLLTKDNGWMAAYYDALSRTSIAQQTYFTRRRRLRMFYRALRGHKASPSAIRPVFRPDPNLVLLATRFRLDRSGKPRLPGGLAAWKTILTDDRRSKSREVRNWAERARDWKSPDQFVAAMFALTRVSAKDNPLRVFLALNEMDRDRATSSRLQARTVELLAANYAQFGDQYSIFSEFHSLNASSIARYLAVAKGIDRLHDRLLRADAAGIFQANVGLWEILARQGEIPEAAWNRSWQRLIRPFAHSRTASQLFTAAQNSFDALSRAAAGRPHVSQEELVSALAGPPQTNPQNQQIRDDIAAQMDQTFEAQRLVSLDTLFTLGNDLERMAHGKHTPSDFVQMAGDLRELRMPRPLFSSGERAEWGYGYYRNEHVQAEMSTDLRKIVRSHHSSKGFEAARGLLVPFLRDSLVGLNYAYYRPPGGEMLANDPFFVRFHDFSGDEVIGIDQTWKTAIIFGRGWTASGGAHLVGSLANLPYVLAKVDQDFIVPRNVQALVWEDLVPTLLTDAVVPRWWNVSPHELRAVDLYQQLGGNLVSAACHDETLRRSVLKILTYRMQPERYEEVRDGLLAGSAQPAASLLSPEETFYLGFVFRQQFPEETAKSGKVGQELNQLAKLYPEELSWQRLSTDFGDPHPVLADSYGSTLVNMGALPTYMGYSSRLLAETWESNNLYWARLADVMGYSPAMLNILVPELTRRMVANIFATDLEDRAALLRALRQTGNQFEMSRNVSPPKVASALGP